jgi:hypothetical protein
MEHDMSIFSRFKLYVLNSVVQQILKLMLKESVIMTITFKPDFTIQKVEATAEDIAAIGGEFRQLVTLTANDPKAAAAITTVSTAFANILKA